MGGQASSGDPVLLAKMEQMTTAESSAHMPSHPDESAALAIQTPAINDRSLAAGLAYAMGSRVSGISFDAATGP